MNIGRIFSAIVNIVHVCIIGSDSFFEKEKIEDGKLKFRRDFTSINVFKLIAIFSMVILILSSFGGSDSFLKKVLFLFISASMLISIFFMLAVGGAFDQIILDENGITVIRLWDESIRNGKRTEYKWENFTAIRVIRCARGGAGIWIEYNDKKIHLDFTYTTFNFIKQYYPNIDVWIELDESKVK